MSDTIAYALSLVSIPNHVRERTVPEDTRALTRQSEDLYRTYVKPFELHHLGEFIAVSEDGSFVLAPSLLELVDKAEKEVPPGSFLFRVGDIAIDIWR